MQANIVTTLERQVLRLQEELRAVTEKNKQLSAKLAQAFPDSAWPTLHRVYCGHKSTNATYIDTPCRMEGREFSHLEGLWMVDEEGWKSRNSHKPFVVYETYECNCRNRSSAGATDVPPSALREEIRVLSQPLLQLIEQQTKMIPGLQAYLDKGLLKDNLIRPPYVFFYHFGVDIQESARVQDHESYEDFQLLWCCLEQRTQDFRQTISACFDSGYVANEHIPWLFKPGDLLVVRSEVSTVVKQAKIIEVQNLGDESTIGIHVSSIRFDGRFRRRGEPMAFTLRHQPKHKITDLEIYPYRYASAELKAEMLRLGREFFACRKWRYVALNDPVGSEEHAVCKIPLVRFVPC